MNILPQVRLCAECGLHGHITIPANDYSLEFCSINQGLQQLAEEIDAQRLPVRYDRKALAKQILECGLPQYHTSVPMKRLWTIFQWNKDYEECRNDGTILQYNAHAFTQHPDFIIEIPEDFRKYLDNRLRAFTTKAVFA